jgi:hypothetical protein
VRDINVKSAVYVVMIGTMAVLGAVARAQGVPTPQVATAEQLQARREVAAFERMLENAVNYGGQMLTQHVQSSATPESVLLTGLTRARGFRLDGYGVLFDVEFPSIRRTVAWTMRTLERPDPELLVAMKEMRKNTEGFADPRSRQELDRYIKSLEDQMKTYDAQMKQVAMSGQQGAAAAPPVDPRVVYATEMISALMDAILDHGSPVGIGPDEWLTVAARESLDLRFVDNPNDRATTLILRMKGSDLKALKDRQLSRDEARKKIEVKQN